MTDEIHTDGDLTWLARAFQVSLNVVRVHDPENEAAQRTLRRLLEGIHTAFLQDGECVITLAGDHVFVNRERVRSNTELTEFRQLLLELEVGGMAFSSPPEPDALAEFVVHLARDRRWQAPEECFVEPVEAGIEIDTTPGEGPTPRRVYERAIGEVREIYREARQRGELSMRRARRLVGDVIETLVSDEGVLLGLMAIREYDLYTFQHCVNVCILASSLGTRLGLGRTHSRELGVAALFHDIGKTQVPHQVLTKPGKFTPQEWEIMKSHPLLGARVLLQSRGLEPSSIRATQVALEHHIRNDGGGYPTLRIPSTPILYSRITSLCDCYDAMSSVRMYREVPITPPVTMSYIWSQAGKAYDAPLVKAFLRVLGAYPPGSLVRLSDQSMAVCVAGPTTDDVFQPVVTRWGTDERIDLATAPSLSVVRCLEPNGLVDEAELQAHLSPAA